MTHAPGNWEIISPIAGFLQILPPPTQMSAKIMEIYLKGA